MANLLNQTMVDAFFGCIGIFIGFLQAAFFQLTIEDKTGDSTRRQRLENKPKLIMKYKPGSKPRTKQNTRTLLVLFLVQELLLFSFFISLIYIFFFGTFVCREPLPNGTDFATCYSVHHPENNLPKTEDEAPVIPWFRRAIDKAHQFTNTIVVFCVGSIFSYNIYLLLCKIFPKHRKCQIIIPSIAEALVIGMIILVVFSTSIGYIEKTSLYDIINSLGKINLTII